MASVLLQTQGVLVDARDRRGETPFHAAIENGHLQTGGMADVLLHHRANINAQDSLGYTCLLQVIAHSITSCIHPTCLTHPHRMLTHPLTTVFIPSHSLNALSTPLHLPYHTGGTWRGC